MTVHSPSGTDPEAFGVRRRNAHVHAFANNEVAFVENRGYDIRLVGEGLDEALRHYMAGDGSTVRFTSGSPGKRHARQWTPRS